MAAFDSITDLTRAYAEGRTTPTEVVRAAIAEIALLNPSLNAFADPMAAAAMEEAAEMTIRLEAGQARGALFGIPVAIKDLIEVAGAPTGYGSKVRPPRMAMTDAVLVARLRTAGAIILGKTNLLEYAYGIAHPEIGQTNNPHDPQRTAGGSSGGSAAAVAAGIVPLAVGTDTGGSIRIPAAYCGIVGMKPTFGLVPLDGVFPLSPTLDHAGPLARCVTDAARMLAVMSDRPMVLLDVPLAGLRIGVLSRHLSRTALGAAVTAHVEGVLADLARLGARVTMVDAPELAQVNTDLVTILLPEAALIHAPLLAENPAGYAPGTKAQIEAGRRGAAFDYLAARQARRACTAAVDALFADVDVLLSPAVPFIAPFEDPEIAEGDDSEMLASGFANLTGHPSLSLPCGQIDGLPVGLQLTGPRGQDAHLLGMARAIEAVMPG